MIHSPNLPIIRPLPPGFSLEAAFARFCGRPGCLWLDSASSVRQSVQGEEQDGGKQRVDHQPGPDLGRYSFLMCDPVETLVANLGDEDPWPKLKAWCHALPSHGDTIEQSGPPFQGGIAGLIGYEAATWLESVGVAAENDLPTPAMSLGLYDWTIATDHQAGRSWIISQGLGAKDPARRYETACERADQVEAWLGGDTEPSAGVRREIDVDSGIDVDRGIDVDPGVAAGQYRTDRHGVRSNMSSDQFRDRAAEIVRSICDGDSFQVNLAQRLLKKAHLSSPELYLRLRDHNPAPFSAFYRGAGFEVLSSSPEGFLRSRQGLVETRPIKGTVPRTGDADVDDRLAAQLSESAKDRAENVMIVDLMRNDLSRVCADESVVVQDLCKIERYEFVQHLVSVVQGRLRDGMTVADLLKACFPGGSITGAPKIEAMRTIARLEPNRRGPYCGSIGYISCSGNADFNILIRTITSAHGYWQIPVGGGITARSDPAAEEAETWAKAEGMLRAVAD